MLVVMIYVSHSSVQFANRDLSTLAVVVGLNDVVELSTRYSPWIWGTGLITISLGVLRRQMPPPNTRVKPTQSMQDTEIRVKAMIGE